MANFVLIHGVAPELRAKGHDVMTPDLPCDDDSAGLSENANVVVDAIGERTNLILVAQSMGGFIAPLVCDRVRCNLLILIAGMVPLAGEKLGDWWTNTGWERARRDQAERTGRPMDADFDPMFDFFHDVPPRVVAEAFARGQRRQSGTPFQEQWPLTAWPDCQRGLSCVGMIASSLPALCAALSTSGWA